ncbi:MAG: molybdopterin-dependent oxidoreductase [Alphaproteobacteria bacterium]|nr:molybdopterin-dependent oxidoreductase [Alphaproteobacteria bacterium]
MAVNKEIIKTTCPRDCYDSCGIEVLREDGRIVSVRGDKEHFFSRGKLCAKCQIFYNGVVLDQGERLKQPLRRVAAKGEGRFEPVSWDTAISEIAARLGHIVEANGADNILHAHYTGTCSLIANCFPLRFFYRLGAREVEPDTVCNMAGHVALGYVIGSSVLGFDPRTAEDSKCIMVWGANPSACAPHAHSHWLPEAPCPVVVVDPVRHATAEAAELHLQLFPGSDAALAFAIMHVLRREGLIDRDFLAANCIGWDELEPTLEACTPEWGAAETGVPAADIVRAAELYGAGPALLWLGQGLQRQPMGGNIMRACAMLPALCGNYAKPGAGLLYLNGAEQKGVDGDYVVASHLSNGPDPISQMDLAEYLESAENARAFLCWNINPVASSPEQSRLMQAMTRDDLFTVVLDIFATDTTDYADYVLPAASFLEFDDLVGGYFNMSFSAQVKAAEPIGEALPNQEIFRRLARAMGFTEPELQESDADIIDTVMEGVDIAGDFAALKASGTLFPSAEAQLQFADLNFPTPSGKIEIASAAAAADGHPRLPGPGADARPTGGRLRLLSPATEWLLNDSYANDPKVDKQLGPAMVTINPADAEARGLAAGSQVRLTNATGSLELNLALSDMVPPGVALSPKGRWPRRAGKQRANVNVLNPGAKSDMGESTAVHGVEVEIGAV